MQVFSPLPNVVWKTELRNVIGKLKVGQAVPLLTVLSFVTELAALSCTVTIIILTVCIFLLLWMVRHAHSYVSSGRNDKKQLPFPTLLVLYCRIFLAFSK